MSELSADQVYKFIDEFPAYQELVEFVKRFLSIKDGEINDIKHDYPYSIREQKYQIIQKWKRKVGRRATIELLHQTLADFRGQNNEVDDGRSQPLSTPSQATESPRPPRSQTSDMASGRNTEPGNGAVGSTPPLQLRDPITETNQSNESEETRDRAATGEVHEAQVPGKAFPGDQASAGGLSDQIGNLSLDEGYCNKVENLTVKICSADAIREIERKIRANDAYKIGRSGTRGYVLIINNNFATGNGRDGAELDVRNMKKLWSKLGCKVQSKEDLTADEIDKTLQIIASWEGIADYDFLVLFIMSHGTLQQGDDMLEGSDSKLVYVRDVLSKFNNDNCRFLRQKPKLFFFQFCRGSNIDQGVLCNDTEKKLAESMLEYQTVQRDMSNLMPCRSDILVSYATQQGYAAYRDHHGSWFINAIAKIFAEFAHEEHVEELMIKVRQAVMKKSGITVCPNNRAEYMTCKEMSESHSLLTKKLYLIPTNMSTDPLAD